MAALRQCCAAHRRQLRNRMPPLMPAIQASTSIRTMAVCCRATPAPQTTDIGPITVTGRVSGSAGSTPAGGAAGSATALPTVSAEDERFALVTPSPITALVTASPMPPGSVADSALDCQLRQPTAHDHPKDDELHRDRGQLGADGPHPDEPRPSRGVEIQSDNQLDEP